MLDRQEDWTRVRYLGKEDWVDARWTLLWDRKEAYRVEQRNLVERAVSSNAKCLKAARNILGTRGPVPASRVWTPTRTWTIPCSWIAWCASPSCASFLEEIADDYKGYGGTLGLLLKHLGTDLPSLDKELEWWIRPQNKPLEDRYR